MRLARGLILSTILVTGANAADYLRGSISEPAYQAGRQSASYDWSGFYVGGTASYNNATLKPNGTGASLAEQALPNLSITDQVGALIHVQKGKSNGAGFGVFGGYNMMWDDVVVGVEAEYNRVKLDQTLNIDPIGRYISDTGSTDTRYAVRMTSGYIRTAVENYGVARGRAGVAYGRLMPYATFGVVGAYVKTTGNLKGSATEEFLNSTTGAWDPGGTVTFDTTRKSNQFKLGYAMGLGVDYAFTDNIFLRAKYEYLSIPGTKSTEIDWHVAKVGIGAKF